jgi:hypothetical protein
VESRLILLEPETAEPCRNVHARLPTRSMPRSHRTSICRCARILDGVVAAEVMRLMSASRGREHTPRPQHRRDGSMMQVAWKAPRHRRSPVREKSGGAGRGARNCAFFIGLTRLLVSAPGMRSGFAEAIQHPRLAEALPS